MAGLSESSFLFFSESSEIFVIYSNINSRMKIFVTLAFKMRLQGHIQLQGEGGLTFVALGIKV